MRYIYKEATKTFEQMDATLAGENRELKGISVGKGWVWELRWE